MKTLMRELTNEEIKEVSGGSIFDQLENEVISSAYNISGETAKLLRGAGNVANQLIDDIAHAITPGG